MKKITLFFFLFLISTFSFGQGYFDLEEVNKSSLIYSQCKIKWTELNDDYLVKLIKFRDSISDIDSKLPAYVEMFIQVNTLISEQTEAFATGWDGEDFNLGLLYDYKQDSAMQKFMVANELSYIFGAKTSNKSSVLYLNKKLNLTSDVTKSLLKKPSNSVIPQKKIKFAFASLPVVIKTPSFFAIDSNEQLKLASKLVAEENGIDIILKKEEMRNNVTEIILYGSEKLDVTELIMAKYNNKPVPAKQLKINPTISGVNLDLLIEAVGKIHPDYQREKNLLWAKYKNDFSDPTKEITILKAEQNLEKDFNKLSNKYVEIIKAEIAEQSIAMAKKLNYDVLISLESPGSGNLFDNYDEIHIAQDHNLSKKVYEVFVEKYKVEN